MREILRSILISQGIDPDLSEEESLKQHNRAYKRAYYQAHKEQTRAYSRAYYQAHKEHYRAYRRTRKTK